VNDTDSLLVRQRQNKAVYRATPSWSLSLCRPTGLTFKRS